MGYSAGTGGGAFDFRAGARHDPAGNLSGLSCGTSGKADHRAGADSRLHGGLGGHHATAGGHRNACGRKAGGPQRVLSHRPVCHLLRKIPVDHHGQRSVPCPVPAGVPAGGGIRVQPETVFPGPWRGGWPALLWRWCWSSPPASMPPP